LRGATADDEAALLVGAPTIRLGPHWINEAA
jgi:hypothetical protein